MGRLSAWRNNLAITNAQLITTHLNRLLNSANLSASSLVWGRNFCLIAAHENPPNVSIAHESKVSVAADLSRGKDGRETYKSNDYLKQSSMPTGSARRPGGVGRVCLNVRNPSLQSWQPAPRHWPRETLTVW